MSRNIFLVSLAILSLSACRPEKPLVDVPMTKAMTGAPAPCEQFVWGGFPRMSSSSGKLTTSFVCREFYGLNFNTIRGTSDWVVEKMTKDNLKAPEAKLIGSEVRPDTELPKSKQTTVSDYEGIGYKKGFFASPNNFRFSEIAYSYSFYLTNIFPIHPDQEKTMHLVEDWIRSQAVLKNELYVISGPVYENGNGLGWVGQAANPSASGDGARRGKIQVPTGIFKVLFSPSTGKAVAFEIPNAPTNKSLGQMIVSFPVLEKKTGLVFFPDFPVPQQAAIKSGTISSF